jgi:serine/threonine protein phosphatase PrpC
MMKQKNLKLSKTPILSNNVNDKQHYGKYHKHNKDNHGLCFSSSIFRYIVGFTIIVAYLNYRFVYSYSGKVVEDQQQQQQQQKYHSKVSSVNLSTLSYFEPPTMPSDHLQKSSEHRILKEWQKWAKKPIVGSYQYNPMTTTTSKSDTTTSSSSSSIIHFPSIDLEHYYHGDEKLEKKSLSTTGISTSTSWFITASKTSTCIHSYNTSAVLTRQGHKFSQGESTTNDDEQQQGGGNNDNGGLYRQPNQDRILVLDRFGDSHEKKSSRHDDFAMFLFDGHGPYGQIISQYASLEFARRIHQEWQNEEKIHQRQNQDDVKETLKTMFLDVNKSLPRAYASGSTAICTWRRGSLLYISNLGDSVGFVASYDKQSPQNVEIMYTTKPHKPDSPSERQRIESVGGRVEDPIFPGATARLLIPMPNNIDMFGLAMSRSLGDHDGEKYGLIAEPTTDVLDLTKFDFIHKEYFVVAATDGLIDHDRLSTAEVAERISKSFFVLAPSSDSATGGNIRGQKNSEVPLQAAEQLVLKASKLWRDDPHGFGYRDDISIALRRLQF